MAPILPQTLLTASIRGVVVYPTATCGGGIQSSDVAQRFKKAIMAKTGLTDTRVSVKVKCGSIIVTYWVLPQTDLDGKVLKLQLNAYGTLRYFNLSNTTNTYKIDLSNRIIGPYSSSFR